MAAGWMEDMAEATNDKRDPPPSPEIRANLVTRVHIVYSNLHVSNLRIPKDLDLVKRFQGNLKLPYQHNPGL